MVSENIKGRKCAIIPYNKTKNWVKIIFKILKKNMWGQGRFTRTKTNRKKNNLIHAIAVVRQNQLCFR